MLQLFSVLRLAEKLRCALFVLAIAFLPANFLPAGDTPAPVEGPAITFDAAKPEASAAPAQTAKASEPTKPEKSAQAESLPQTESSSPSKADGDSAPHAQKPAGVAGPNLAEGDKSEGTPASNKPANASEPSQPTPASEKDRLPVGTNAMEAFGEPLAAGIMKLLHDEVVAGDKRRGIAERFARFQSYAIGKVNASAGRYTGSELAGNCRLKWYDHLMRHLLSAPAEAERFTRDLHTAARNPRGGLGDLLAIAGEKMDVGKRKPRKLAAAASPEQALDAVREAIVEAQASYGAALAPLTKSEIRELQSHLVPVLCTQNQVGHTVNDRGTARRLCDLMEKMDRTGLHMAAEALAPLADVELLEQLKSLPAEGDVKVPGVSGPVAARLETPGGVVLIGGKGPNTYQLDQMREVSAVIDLGGGNTFHEGTVGLDRPVLVVINLDGNNVFRGSKAGIQGGAVLGVSMLLNYGGNNTYDAQDVAQGSAVAGIGILIDYGSKNRYRGVRRVQGQALGGIGILIGRGGKNDYRAAMWAQGFGGPLGFGLLDNVVGDNHYYCGGMWRDSYPETPGCEGWGQGVGAGLRQVANGGIGVILDNGGENTYEFDYLSHGGGYWCGLGFARDFGGNTKRLITRTAYNGGPRTEPKFQRFGCGWGCHYALGFLFDDAGNDEYEGTIMGTGMAWDCSMGILADFAGNDHYKATGGLTQGTGAQMGFGVLFDYKGDDRYDGYGQGYAPSGISYHTLPACGGNFSFLVDYGGKDKYGCGADNNSYVQRGDSGGFLVDRPQREELQRATVNSKPANGASGS